MTKVIEYMEKLEELEATPKQSGNKIGDKDQSEDKTGKSKSKTKGEKRKRNNSGSEDNCCYKYCAICKAKGGSFWTHNTEECRPLTGYQKNKRIVTQNLTKKEFHALTESQMKEYFGNKEREPQTKRVKGSSDSSLSSSESSDCEE